MADTVNNPRDQIEHTVRRRRSSAEVYATIAATARGIAVVTLGIDAIKIIKERLLEVDRPAALFVLGVAAVAFGVSVRAGIGANTASQEAAALEGALAADRLAAARQADAAAPAEDKAE